MPVVMPPAPPPMLARSGPLPPDDASYGYEVKWDGVRAIASVAAGGVGLRARSGTDIAARYPEVAPLAQQLGGRGAILDGEIVALDARGRPSFERLQSRMHLGSEAAVAGRLRELPVTFIVFDVLFLDGAATLSLPYRERRELLAALALEGPAWRAPAHREHDGAALLAATAEQGLEGIVAKRLDSPYEPGRRSSAWIKVKNHTIQDVVIGGWTRGEGGRARSLGALTVGTYDVAVDAASGRGAPQRLLYAGRVGSGFNAAALDDLGALLEPLRRERSPFTGRQPPRATTTFVEPLLVARVEFSEWTASGTLRAPVYRGLRDDVDPGAVVREG